MFPFEHSAGYLLPYNFRMSKHSTHESEELRLLREIRHAVKIILYFLERLEHPNPARSAKLTITNAQGENIMPLIVHLNDSPGQAVFAEFDGLNGTGNKVPPVGAVIFASDNSGIAAIDPNTGALAYVGAGTCTISGSDSGNSLKASDSLTVIASMAQSATLTLVAGPLAARNR